MDKKSLHLKNSFFWPKTEKKNRGNDIEYDKIVKFLIAQRSVLDYADLN